MTEEKPPSHDLVPLRSATRTWFLISLQTFGGPAGQIAIMQRMLVDDLRWIGHRRFLFALSFCTLLPGPEAQQLATYVGWLLNGVKGALIAGGLFVLPGVVALLALSAIYVGYGDTRVVEALFLGLAPAVVAIVIQAVIRLTRRGLGNPWLVSIAVGSFVALAVFAVPFPVVIAVAAVLGYVLTRDAAMHDVPAADEDPDDAPLVSDAALHAERPSARRSLGTLLVGVVLWFAPIAVAALALGGDSVVVDQGLFFSGTAVVTFGGARRSSPSSPSRPSTSTAG